MNLIGKIIGNRYEILEEAGNGGMATVYKAKDHVLNRFVAVKILKDEYTTDSDFIKRFNTEAQSAAALTHPNIVSIFDVGHEEENNLYYIVMELIKGKTLKEIIDKDKKISWKWSVNIAIQIASALELAHKNGIIHRDIKPHNIIITEDGVAKVTDFGIAKAVSNSTITAFGTTIGSVHYFSPEQAKGSLTDAKSDIYSLGVVMYEMLTGKVPFDADTPVSVALKHMQEDPIPPIELNENIPSAVNDITMKAMQKDPSQRYKSATAMLADLSKALKDPDGDFVIVENADGKYTRVMKAITDEDLEDDEKPKKGLAKYFAEHKKTKIAVIILSLILLFVVVFLATKLILDGGIQKKVDLPKVTEMTEADARKAIENAKLKVEVGEAQASSTVEEGKVISQEPPYQEGKKVEEGSTVKIILSKGPETTELPDFTEKDIEDVRKEAAKMGITLDEKTENSDKIAENKVISQDTKPGVLVKSGDTVTVHVSAGVKKVTVPTVVDMDEGTAKATLKNSNLNANVTYTNDSSKGDGKVVSQSIEQGKEIAEGTTIDLVVNKIEKVKKTINLKISQVPESTSSSNTNQTNETDTSTSKKVTITTYVNGAKNNSTSALEGASEVSCGSTTITEGQQNVKIKVDIEYSNKSTKTIESTFSDNGWTNGATFYVDK